MNIDASNMVLGRFASYVAKKAMLGEEINIVNCEKVVISGKKPDILNKQKIRLQMGQPFQGPLTPKTPDRFVRRVIRGMLPRKQEKGIMALARIKCYKGVPDALSKEKLETVESAKAKRTPEVIYLTVGEICRLIGKK